MKRCWFIPIALLIPLHLSATDTQVGARVATITINPREITVLHLRPEFESTIRMPEEVTSVILGSPVSSRPSITRESPSMSTSSPSPNWPLNRIS